MLGEVAGLPFTVWLQEGTSECQLNVVGLKVEGGTVCVLVSLERDLGEIVRPG